MRAALVLASLVAAVAASFVMSVPAATAKIACGSERWNVKTLQDRPRLKPTKDTTIAALIKIPKVSPLPPDRMA
jgi:hypothetical protein